VNKTWPEIALKSVLSVNGAGLTRRRGFGLQPGGSFTAGLLSLAMRLLLDDLDYAGGLPGCQRLICIKCKLLFASNASI